MGRPLPNRFSQKYQRRNPGNRVVHIPLPNRPEPIGMQVLQEVHMSARNRRLANFLGGGRATGTSKHHNGVVKDYFRYMYIQHLAKQFHFLCQYQFIIGFLSIDKHNNFSKIFLLKKRSFCSG